MYRSERSKAQALKRRDLKRRGKTRQSVQDTVAQDNHDASQGPEAMFNSSSDHSATTDPSPAQPLETDTPYGLRASQRRSFQVQDAGVHPIHGMTAGIFASETQISSCYDHLADDPEGTEPTQATTTEVNDVRPNQSNTAGRQSTAPPPSQTLPDDSPRKLGPSKRRSLQDQEDDGEPVHGGFSARPAKPPKWNDEIEFDETEEVEMRDSKGRRGKKGGKILPRHVWSLQPGVRFVVPFNALDQPVGKGGCVLVKFLGDVAKNGELCPVGEVNWHKVDKSYKADIIALVHEKFVLPPCEEINKGILKHVRNRWRDYRHELKLLYKKPDKTEEQVASVVPKGVVPSQWVKLVHYWFKCEFLSTKGREARAAQSHLHTAGSKSFAWMRDEFDAAAALVAQSAPTSSSQHVALENKVFNELMYSDEDERFQQRVGCGFGVNNRKMFGVEGELRKRGYWLSGISAKGASFRQSQFLGVKEKPKKSSYIAADTSAEVERLNFAMAATSATNELMQAQLQMQSKQLKMQSQQLQMQSEQMEALQSQLQQVTSLLTKFGVMLHNGPIHSASRGASRGDVDFGSTQVLEDSGESSDGESESSEWDSE